MQFRIIASPYPDGWLNPWRLSACVFFSWCNTITHFPYAVRNYYDTVTFLFPIRIRRLIADSCRFHDDVTKWKRFSGYLPIVREIHRVTGEFHSQRPATRSFDVFVDLCLNKRLSKQARRQWSETPPRPLWRHCYVVCSIVTSFAMACYN